MTTNKQFQAFMNDFAEQLNEQRKFLANENQRWGYDQAITIFLTTSAKAEYHWIWEKSGLFQDSINAWTGVNRIRHVEMIQFREKCGINNPPVYDLKGKLNKET